jgi:hypothetical protein
MDKVGQESCVPCPIGRYNNELGLSSLDNCKMCPDSEAFECPAGGTFPLLRAGFFRDTYNYSKAYRCMSTEACPFTGANLSTVCGMGYQGFRCDNCLTTYYKSSNQCLKCPNSILKWILLALFCSIMLYILLKIAIPSKNYAASIRLALQSIQILAIFPRLSNRWSVPLLRLFNFLSFSNLSFESLSYECDVSLDYWTLWRMKLNIPLILIGMLGLIYCLQRSFSILRNQIFKQRSRSISLYPIDRFIYCFILLFNFVYVYLIATLIEPMNCYQTGISIRLAANSSKVCFDNEWRKQYIAPAIIYSFLYVIIVPVLYGYIFKANRSKIHENVFQDRFGSLTRPYKPNLYWYEIVAIVKKFVVAVLPESISFWYSADSKSLVAFIGIFTFLLIESNYSLIEQNF